MKFSKVKFNKVVMNADNIYKTLWSDDHETHWFLCSSSRQFTGKPYEVDEVMVFAASEQGVPVNWTEIAVRHPHSIDHAVHEELVQEAYDNLVIKEGQEFAKDVTAEGQERMRRKVNGQDMDNVDWKILSITHFKE